jgi:pyruvate/2-oxoglutarate dehydrogenase complex dihydrolipoamide acyltransferase (E2) component
VSSSTTEAAAVVDVTMPQMGVSVAEGTVVAWAKQIDDAIAAEETICEISTDKIDTEVSAPVSGTLVEILVGVGETVEVRAVLARIAVDGPSPEAAAAAPAAAPVAPPRRYSPVVMRVAAAHDVDLAAVPGSGRNGRVTKRDVLDHIADEPSNGTSAPLEPERPLHSESPYRADAPAAAAGLDDLGGRPESLSRIRRSIGEAMSRSLATAATCTTVVECDMTRIELRRRELGLTALPLVARATVATLREFPDLNARLEGDTLTRYERVHLGIAVSLGSDGLIVPVIHDAQELSPEGLGRRIKDIAARARGKQLTPDDVRGATFTITSPGAFGALIATPVIDVPQVAILDLETIVRRPVVVTDTDGEEAIAIRSMANLCMSWDHRALDGVYAASFLTALRHRIEGEPLGAVM